MRPIHLARIDKTRPVLILTRQAAQARMSWISVAPITSTIKGLTVEIRVGTDNGLDHDCVVNVDNIQTIAASSIGRQIGRLLPDQELQLTNAIHAAFDLDAS